VQLDDVLDSIYRDHVAILDKGDRTANLRLWNNMSDTETMRTVKTGWAKSLHENSHVPPAESSVRQAGDIKSQAGTHD